MPQNGRLSSLTSSPSPHGPAPPGSPAKRQRRRREGPLVAWTAAEDATIMRLRSTVPPLRWADIADAVNLLTPGGSGRTVNAVRLRHCCVLRFEDQSGRGGAPDPLNVRERELLGRAVKDVECMADKWWFVSARYAELRKARNGESETRELGKFACKRWCSVLKDEQAKEAGQPAKEMEQDDGVVVKIEMEA